MRITIPRSEIKEALAGLSRVVSRRATLPILQGVKFSAKDGLLRVTATDLDQNLCYNFGSAEIEKAGAFVVNCEALKPFTRGKDEDRVILEEVGDAVAITNTVSGHAIIEHVAKFDVKEWPVDPPDVQTKSVDGKFIEYFRKAVPFASTDESRALLNTIHLDVSGTGHCIVATDGRRLTSFNSMALPLKMDCNIRPSKFLTWPKLTGDIEIGAKKINDAVWFCLKNQHWIYQSKSVDGTYPNWRQIIPERGAHAITFAENDVLMLSKVLSWFAGIDNKSNPITLVGKDGKLTLYGYNQENSSWSTLELKESRYEGPNNLLTVNRDYMLDAWQSGFRTFTFGDNHSPVYADDGQGKHVLMPITPMTPDGVVVGNIQPEEVSAQVEPAQAPADEVQVNETAETKPKKEYHKMPEETKTETALDRILVAFDAAKAKLSDARAALFEISDAIKLAVREQRNQKNDLENARVLLGKLQAVKL